MNEDFSEVINKFSSILKEKNIDLNNIAGGTTPPADHAENNTAENSSDNSSNNDFSLDIETILKIKNIFSKINENQNCPRNKLLHSLKPYLEKEKQEKLEKYIKIAGLLSVIENMDAGFSFLNDNKNGYDFILIITLFLLII